MALKIIISRLSREKIFLLFHRVIDQKNTWKPSFQVDWAQKHFLEVLN